MRRSSDEVADVAGGLQPAGSFTLVSLAALAGWGVFYVLFLLYAAANTSGFLFIDHANLMFHEAGHFLFAWAGYHTQILGGTLGQLLALPLVGSDESDWTILFTYWGVLQQDRAIAAWMRGIGWIGMVGSVAWLVWMGMRRQEPRAGT